MMVGGEAFSIDASLIKADVDKMKRLPGDQPIAWPKAEEASHAVREYIAALDAASVWGVVTKRVIASASSTGLPGVYKVTASRARHAISR